VGLSGGIDSAMTAYLLKMAGYRLTGVTMSTWDENYSSQEAIRSGCFGPGEVEDISSAAEICRRLEIPHIVIDLKCEFHNTVLEYFRKVYLSGRTPNPCVICNREIKFGLLPMKARELGYDFDYFATGHYARIEKKDSGFNIARGVDKNKDQSYFLCRLSEQQLSETLLPLGGYQKEEIRKLARDSGFDYLVYRRESQDFIETDDYGFIFGRRGVEPGDIVDKKGRKIGQHQGIIYYTVGQRRGLNLSGLSEPYYVLEIDTKNNRIIAGEKSGLYSRELIASDVIWADGKAREGTFKLQAQIRLQHRAARCSITHLENHHYKVSFAEPQLSITPGQIVAFYDGDIVLGGGVIENLNTSSYN